MPRLKKEAVKSIRRAITLQEDALFLFDKFYEVVMEDLTSARVKRVNELELDKIAARAYEIQQKNSTDLTESLLEECNEQAAEAETSCRDAMNKRDKSGPEMRKLQKEIDLFDKKIHKEHGEIIKLQE